MSYVRAMVSNTDKVDSRLDAVFGTLRRTSSPANPLSD